VSELLERFRRLPRAELQRELRRITGDDQLSLWENLGYGWMYWPVRAGPEAAAKLGTPVHAVIGYHVAAGHVFGGAITDLMDKEPQDQPPYPDPFAAERPQGG